MSSSGDRSSRDRRRGGSDRKRSDSDARPPKGAAAGRRKSARKGPSSPPKGRGGEGYRQRSDAQRQSSDRRSGGAPRKYASRADGKRERESDAIPGNRQWGGLARKGALRATHDEVRSHRDDRTRTDTDLTEEELQRRQEREERRAAREQRAAELREEAKTAVARAHEGRRPARRPRAKPPLDRAPLGHGRARNEDEAAALRRLLGRPEGDKQLRKLRTAAQSYEAERYADARKSLKSIAELAPSVPEVRELLGLTLYRMGRYREAAKELEAFRELADSTEQNPVLADCYRALERWADVAELWDELSGASPGAAAVTEGRIVMAGSLADQGDLDGAVRLLQKGWKRTSRPREHHLRRAYALADLYERSGDVPRARSLFDWIAGHDRRFADARRRAQNLR